MLAINLFGEPLTMTRFISELNCMKSRKGAVVEEGAG